MLVVHGKTCTCHSTSVISTATTVQKQLQMPYMLVWYFGKNDHVINVTLRKGQAKADLIHHSLQLNNAIFRLNGRNF